MFRRVMSHHATNDAGVEVLGVDQHLIEYREGPHVLRLGREGAAAEDDGPAQIVYIDNFLRWQPPHSEEPISSADADRIAANIVAGFAALRLPTFIERRGL